MKKMFILSLLLLLVLLGCQYQQINVDIEDVEYTSSQILIRLRNYGDEGRFKFESIDHEGDDNKTIIDVIKKVYYIELNREDPLNTTLDIKVYSYQNDEWVMTASHFTGPVLQ